MGIAMPAIICPSPEIWSKSLFQKQVAVPFCCLYLGSQRKLLELQVDLLKTLFKDKTLFLEGIKVPLKIFPGDVSSLARAQKSVPA